MPFLCMSTSEASHLGAPRAASSDETRVPPLVPGGQRRPTTNRVDTTISAVYRRIDPEWLISLQLYQNPGAEALICLTVGATQQPEPKQVLHVHVYEWTKFSCDNRERVSQGKVWGENESCNQSLEATYSVGHWGRWGETKVVGREDLGWQVQACREGRPGPFHKCLEHIALSR